MDVTRCIAAVAFATSNTLLRWCSHSMLRLARSVAADRVHRGRMSLRSGASVRRSAGWCERRRVTRRVGCLSSGLSHTRANVTTGHHHSDVLS
jgi:hypothetical protein